MIKHWLKAFRLRTLPLAFSSVIVGTAIAIEIGFFDWIIFILALTTTLFLQILSNLANDYGDAQKGTDNANRVGPERSIQSGAINKIKMKKGNLHSDFFVGDKMEDAYKMNKNSRWFKTYNEMHDSLAKMRFQNVDVLVKGSRSLRLERIQTTLKKILT